MFEKANADVREAIKNSSLHQYEIAYAIGISEATLCVWLRRELPDDRKQLIYNAIQKLSAAC